jgi:SulP family sulfate permease
VSRANRSSVIIAVAPLIRLDRIVQLAKLSRPQVTITLRAFVLSFALSPHLERAILAAVSLSILIHLWRELRLDLTATTTGTQLELIPQGVLWFGTARLLEDRFGDLLAQHPNASELELQLDGLGRIDFTGALALKSLIDGARGAGLTVTVHGAPRHASRILARVIHDDVVDPDEFST